MSNHFKAREWRTVFVAEGGLVALLVGLALVCGFPVGLPAYTMFALTVGGVVAAVCGKAYGDAKETARTPPETIRAQAAAAGGPPAGPGAGATQ